MASTTGWRHGKPIEIDLVTIGDGLFLHRPAAEAFRRMSAKAALDGVVFQVNTAYRSMSYQRRLWDEYEAAQRMGKPHALVAKPGWSNHQAGIAVDISCMGIHADAFQWLNDHGHEFGFKRTVPSEPWHWEFRGDSR